MYRDNLTKLRDTLQLLVNDDKARAWNDKGSRAVVDMSEWQYTNNDELDWALLSLMPVVDKYKHAKDCGFVGCAAGWATMLSATPPERTEDVAVIAMLWLGLTPGEAWQFFHGHVGNIVIEQWTDELLVAYLDEWLRIDTMPSFTVDTVREDYDCDGIVQMHTLEFGEHEVTQAHEEYGIKMLSPAISRQYGMSDV